MEIGSLVPFPIHLRHGERVVQKVCCKIIDEADNIFKKVELVFTQIINFTSD